MPSASHSERPAPSPWFERFAPLVPAGGRVLDLACGSGRHSALFLERGHPVTALDRDLSRLGDLAGAEGLEAIQADLETGAPFPLAGRRFAAVLVANYLHRPLFPALIEALEPGGLLLYETFALGNERYGKPSNPDFLLKPGELLEAAQNGGLRVLAYEDLEVSEPRPACLQRIAARKAA